jgi:hypothetical protein
MSADRTIELGGFEQRLLAELRAVVAEHAVERPARRAPRWSLAAGLAAVAAACAAVLIAVSAGSSPSLAQAFPILARPATQIPSTVASLLRGAVTVPRARLDLRHARTFRTPLGIGYVVADRHLNTMCVAAPGFDHQYGGTCGNATTALHEGVGGLMTFGGRGTSYVDVLPRDAAVTLRSAGGPARRAILHDGVLAFITDRTTTVTTRIGGHVTTVRVPVPTRPAAMPLPSRAQVAAPVRLRFAGRLLYATFRARYPTRRGLSAYVIELDHTDNRGGTTSASGAPTASVSVGELVRLSAGLPLARSRWRVTVFYAGPTGAVRNPADWPPVLGNVSAAPKGSGAQIVWTRVMTIGPRRGLAVRGPRTSRSGG